VDGVPTPLWRANYAFEAVAVPAGKHRILLTYKDRAFRWGAGISLAAIMICGSGWLRANSKGKKQLIVSY